MTIPPYEYKIGTTRVGMQLLSTLGIPAPKNTFVPYSTYITLANGATEGNGYPTDEWEWGFITQTQRTTLKTFFATPGAHIFIRDLKDDGLTWKDFEVEAEWPRVEERVAGRRIPFTIVIKAMVELV